MYTVAYVVFQLPLVQQIGCCRIFEAEFHFACYSSDFFPFFSCDLLVSAKIVVLQMDTHFPLVTIINPISSVQLSSAQFSSVQFSSVQFNSVQFSSVYTSHTNN